MSDFDTLTKNHLQVVERLIQKITTNIPGHEKILNELCLQKQLLKNPELVGKTAKAIRKEIEKSNDYKNMIIAGDDFVSVEKTKEQICSLTQKKIDDKWISQCQHAFERSAVFSYMKKGKVKCPVIGCDKELK
ncbi:hypothetical protein BDAP_000703 [Binucleata daphniae]